jgi:DegV family protein with EDD domain
MNLAIITDSACDLAANFIENYNIEVLPVKIIKGEKFWYDSKDTNFITEIREDLKVNGKNYKTEPLNIEETKDYLFKMFSENPNETYLFLLSNSTRTETYNNVIQVMSKSLNEIRLIRQKNGLKPNIKFEIIDSQQLSTGLGVLISETIVFAKKELEFEELIEKVKQSISYTQALLIPDKLSQLYNQANSKGDSSIGFGSYLLGSALDIKPIIQSYKGNTRAIDKIKGFDKALEMIIKLLISDIRNNRLKFKNISISYGGDSNKRKELVESSAYVKLRSVADENHVSITFSKMGATMMVNVGANVISIGYISSNIINPEEN